MGRRTSSTVMATLVAEHLAAGFCTAQDRTWILTILRDNHRLIARLHGVDLPIHVQGPLRKLIGCHHVLTEMTKRTAQSTTEPAILALHKAFLTYRKAMRRLGEYLCDREYWLRDYAVALIDQLTTLGYSAMALTLRNALSTNQANRVHQHPDPSHVLLTMRALDRAICTAESFIAPDGCMTGVCQQEVA